MNSEPNEAFPGKRTNLIVQPAYRQLGTLQPRVRKADRHEEGRVIVGSTQRVKKAERWCRPWGAEDNEETIHFTLARLRADGELKSHPT